MDQESSHPSNDREIRPLCPFRQALSRVNAEVYQEAKLAATNAQLSGASGALAQVPVSYRSARARILREIRDPPIAHERTRLVYAEAPKPFGTRREEVALAQLRSGRSLFLALYRHQIAQAD